MKKILTIIFLCILFVGCGTFNGESRLPEDNFSPVDWRDYNTNATTNGCNPLTTQLPH